MTTNKKLRICIEVLHKILQFQNEISTPQNDLHNINHLVILTLNKLGELKSTDFKPN